MDGKLSVVLCFLAIHKVLLVQCEYFSVVGSKTLRIDEPFKFAVTNHNALRSETVNVAIIGSTFDGEEYEVFRDVTVAPGETSLAKLKVLVLFKLESFLKAQIKSFTANRRFSPQLPGLSPGSFKLRALAANFSKEVPLYFNSQRVSVLIQINKPVFKPNELVDFRVFIVNSRTKPYLVQDSSKVWILDPNNNRARMWRSPLFVGGLFESSLQLNDADPGTWKVFAEVDGEVWE